MRRRSAVRACDTSRPAITLCRRPAGRAANQLSGPAGESRGNAGSLGVSCRTRPAGAGAVFWYHEPVPSPRLAVMMWIDVIIAVVVVLSAIIGFFRGFLREVLGLAIWIAAFILAFRLAPGLGPWLARWIDADSARIVVAFAIVFIGVLLAGAILNYLLGRLISGTGLAGTDRVLGIVFGVVRGVAVLILLVMLAGVTSVPRDSWWQRSVFIGQLEAGAVWARGYLPPNVAGAITYPDVPDVPQPRSDGTT